MRSPKLFRHHRGRSIESGRDATNTIAIATAYSIKRSIIAVYPFTNHNVTCANGGKAVTGVAGMRNHAHAGAQFDYKANATGPVALERLANKTNEGRLERSSVRR